MAIIVIDDKIPFIKGVLEPFASVKYIRGSDIAPADLKDCDGLIIRTRTRCDEHLLKNSGVRFIATATIGFDHIDTDYCKKMGISWTNAPGCNSGSVEQYIASVLMHIEVKEQRPLSDMTLGIIGVGNVGRKVERLARALGMKVILNDPPRARSENPALFSSLDELLNLSDIITLHVPLSTSGDDATFHMANESFFRKIKPQSWFINSSRGEVCQSSHLKNARNEGLVKDMVLDVWENEPDIDPELLQLSFIGTPHIAGYSVDGKANGTAMSVQAVSRFFQLGLDNWYPENIPPPRNNFIDLSGEKRNSSELFRKAILHTYAVCEDDSSLRSSPSSFEKLRGDYPPRREFQAYRIKLDPSFSEERNSLREIGFNLE